MGLCGIVRVLKQVSLYFLKQKAMFALLLLEVPSCPLLASPPTDTNCWLAVFCRARRAYGCSSWPVLSGEAETGRLREKEKVAHSTGNRENYYQTLTRRDGDRGLTPLLPGFCSGRVLVLITHT